MGSKTFVLVHGAWHGGWCWSRLAAILRARGHSVTTPTQTGLGERSHLLSPEITLQTFVDDIVGHLQWEDLSDVTLVGHSFGGAPVTGAADAARKRLAGLVYLDAIMMQTGETWLDLLPEDIARDRTAQAQATSGGLSLPMASVESFGVQRQADIDFVAPRLTPHPFATFTTSLTLGGPVGNGLPATYIACTGPPYLPAAFARQRARAHDWPIVEIAAGHDAMVTAPDALAELLERV